MQLFFAAGLLTPNAGLAFWFALTFLIFCILLWKTAWTPILSALQEREEKIDDSIKSAEKALAEAKQIQSDNMKARREADQQAQAIIKEAREASDKVRADEIEKTKASVRQLQESATAEIEREKQNAMNDLRTHVADLAIDAAQKILGENLDVDRQRKLVDTFIDELRSN